MAIIMVWQLSPTFPGDSIGEVVANEALLIVRSKRKIQLGPPSIHRALYFNCSFNAAGRTE